jgi:hypothetical protein
MIRASVSSQWTYRFSVVPTAFNPEDKTMAKGLRLSKFLTLIGGLTICPVWWTTGALGGCVTPVFPVKTDWHRKDADAFWGPSVHWNTHLKQYVILLNRAKDPDWTQEGIYVAFNRDVANPTAWTAPKKILGGLRPDEWYP